MADSDSLGDLGAHLLDNRCPDCGTVHGCVEILTEAELAARESCETCRKIEAAMPEDPDGAIDVAVIRPVRREDFGL
jgi:hypothetical protein